MKIWLAVAFCTLLYPAFGAQADGSRTVNNKRELIALVDEVYGHDFEWLADRLLAYNKLKRVRRATTIAFPEDTLALFCLRGARQETVEALRALLTQRRRFESEIRHPIFSGSDVASFMPKSVIAAGEMEKKLADIEAVLEVELANGLSQQFLYSIGGARNWLRRLASFTADEILSIDSSEHNAISKFAVSTNRHMSRAVWLVVSWEEKRAGPACR